MKSSFIASPSEDAAGIIHMGGNIGCPGNITPAADMNWYYAPEATRQCPAANRKRQLIVPGDLALQVHFTPAIRERLAAGNQIRSQGWSRKQTDS